VAVTEEDRPPLHYAAANGHVDMIAFLLDAGAKVNTADGTGDTALHCASDRGHEPVVVLLLDADAENSRFDPKNAADLNSVSMSNDTEEGNVSAAANNFVRARNKNGETALHRAAFGGHVPVVRALLALSEVNAGADNGNTPLHMASYEGHANVVRLLLENGADIMLKTDGGWTALLSGVMYGHTEVVKVLLDTVAKPRDQSCGGCTPSNLASTEAAVKVGRVSPKNKADGVSGLDGGRLLSGASESDDNEVTTVLSAENEGLSAKLFNGPTALTLAARGGYVDILKMLLDAKANVDDRDSVNWTALHYAARFGQTEVVDILLAAGADAGVLTSPSLSTPLCLAAYDGHLSVMESLLAANSDIISVQDNNGCTALHYAVALGNMGAVDCLLRAGIDVSLEIGRRLLQHLRVDRLQKSSANLEVDVGSAREDDALSPGQVSLSNIEIGLEMAKLYPQSPPTFQELGRIYVAEHDYASAVSSYDIAAGMYPQNMGLTSIEMLYHGDTMCDACEGTPDIVGYRHKCVECWDYDLCHKCFQSSPRPHPEHDFITIPSEEWFQSRVKRNKAVEQE
jgi:ankyrin repeat protein